MSLKDPMSCDTAPPLHVGVTPRKFDGLPSAGAAPALWTGIQEPEETLTSTVYGFLLRETILLRSELVCSRPTLLFDLPLPAYILPPTSAKPVIVSDMIRVSTSAIQTQVEWITNKQLIIFIECFMLLLAYVQFFRDHSKTTSSCHRRRFDIFRHMEKSPIDDRFHFWIINGKKKHLFLQISAYGILHAVHLINVTYAHCHMVRGGGHALWWFVTSLPSLNEIYTFSRFFA